MRLISRFGLFAATAVFAASTQARPPFLTELSYEKEHVAGPAVELSQAEGQRRLDKYRPYLSQELVADTEIAAFEEVNQQAQQQGYRPNRRDRSN